MRVISRWKYLGPTLATAGAEPTVSLFVVTMILSPSHGVA